MNFQLLAQGLVHPTPEGRLYVHPQATLAEQAVAARDARLKSRGWQGGSAGCR